MYKATIYYDMFEDNYEEGAIGSAENTWQEEIRADTQSELRNKVLEATYSKWEDLDDEQMNEYDFATEYHTSYLANASNELANDLEVDLWKQGKYKLWDIDCHILVSEVKESKAVLA